MKTIEINAWQPRTGMPTTRRVVRHLIIIDGQGDGDTPSLVTWKKLKALDKEGAYEYEYVCRVTIKLPGILWGTQSDIWSDLVDLAVEEAKKHGLLKEEVVLGTYFYAVPK